MVITTLFPHRLRRIGWILFIPGVVLGTFYLITDFEWPWLTFTIPSLSDSEAFLTNEPVESGPRWRVENLTNEFICLLILIGSMFVAFSKEKQEDEFHVHLRLSALVWAVYVNAAIQVLAILFIYGIRFYLFMATNLFLTMILFVIRYHLNLRKYKALLNAE